MDDRLVTAARVDEDAQYEAGLRPRRLDEYIGQDRIRENLQVAIAAAKQRNEPLDHVLLHGPPGLGKMKLDRFTLIGATTRTGLLTSPLRSRFGIAHRLEFYMPADLEEIVRRSAKILDVPIEEAAAAEIARRSRGTPRIANRLLRRVRDYAQVRAAGTITLEVAHGGLK